MTGRTEGVRLYWRATGPQAEDVRPFLHLDSVTGDATWANQTKLHAGDKPSSGWPAGFYVVDDYRLLLPADTPPLTARLRVRLLDERGELVPLADGGDLATLADLRIRGKDPARASRRCPVASRAIGWGRRHGWMATQ